MQHAGTTQYVLRTPLYFWRSLAACSMATAVISPVGSSETTSNSQSGIECETVSNRKAPYGRLQGASRSNLGS